MSQMRWTKEQFEAIKSRGDVQVAASAGTGKTAVLSHRCIDLLLDEGCSTDIDKILVLTFTEDAAAEMKQRIAKELKAAYSKGGKSSSLRRQLMRIDIADISTIHSFCRKIVANNFHALGIDPAFTIIDEDEQKLLRWEILTEVIERAWENKKLSANLRGTLEGRNPDIKQGVLNNILRIDEFLSSLVEPEKWIELSLSPSNFEYRFLAALIEDKINVCRALCRQAAILDGKLVDGHYSQDITDFDTNLTILEKAVEQGDREKIEQALDVLLKAKFKNRPKNTEEADYLKARSPIAVTAKKKILEKLKKDLVPLEFFDALTDCQRNDACALLTIADMFGSEYRRRKSELKCLDFNDLERLALKVLTGEDGKASETAKQMQQDYMYVFVDEYQDVNKVQDRIIQLLSKGENLFIVGDVKQSIYSWRQAKPEIFLERIKNADTSEAKNIFLNENFRCRQGIIDFVNTVFSEIMNSDVAGMDYSENAKLIFGARWYEPFDKVCKRKDARCCEMHIITADSGEDLQVQTQVQTAELINTNQRQAELIAKRIEQLVGTNQTPAELQITDAKGNLRDIEYGDIVILMRSLKGRVNDYVDKLREYNIPVEASVTGNYFESPEVNDCLSVLKVLDNPVRDIDFAAVMRSPLFGFADSELFTIRNSSLGCPKPFYYCVCDYAVCGKEAQLAEKITDMLKVLETWRQAASSDNIAHLVWDILLHNDFLSFAAALPGGAQTRADLLKLYERAIQFEGFLSAQGNPSLARFVDFIERLRASDTDWSQAETEAPQGSSVRIMSIHKSKGLEFPVVFIPSVEGKFNTSDTKEVCLFDEDLPMGLKVYLSIVGEQYNTDCFNVIKQKKLTDNVAEQMRTLYVAMTRAREKLILVADTSNKATDGDYNNLHERLEEIKLLTDKNAFNWWLSDCGSRSFLDWFIASLQWKKNIFDVLAKGGKLDDVEIFIAKAAPPPGSEARPKLLTEEADDFTLAAEQLQKRIASRYRYEDILTLPVKNSVSKITHHDDEFKVDYFANTFTASDWQSRKTDEVEPRLVGTATHLVFENLPLSSKPQLSDIEQVVNNLREKGKILPQTAEAIDIEQVSAFFDTEPGKMLFAPGVRVLREYPFTIGLNPSECGFDLPNTQQADDIIVQGVIDLLMITPGGIEIVDFKTDNVSPQNIRERAEIYKRQLRLYSYAATVILKQSVAAQWLYFLKPKQIYRF